MPSSDATPPIWVILPDKQEVVGCLHERRQTPDGWLYKVSVPAWRNEDGRVEPAWYTVWVQAPTHVRPVDGVSYDHVPTERLPQPSAVRKTLGPRRPTGWVLQRLDGQRGSDRGVLHAPDCDEAPHGAPVLPVERALDAAEKAGVRLCTLCGAAQELEPLLHGFDHGFDPDR
ncbi:DUF6233 domain-containing protein [Streptomyces pseudovenezuelae]|uniref:DUF6233 domain-containing protein n=1 Tax=Streptomyces pseudovenezuelae TaxID=67350 RepID=UPI00372451C7